MWKAGHAHAANENTHKPHVHKRHDNMKARSQWNTQAVCHTVQDITLMHAAVQHHKTHVDRRAHGRANSRPHTHTTRSTSVRTPTRNRNSRHECRDPNTTLQHNKACKPESTWLQRARSRTLTWKQDMTGVSCPGVSSQKILTMCYFDVQMWTSWIIMCTIVTTKK